MAGGDRPGRLNFARPAPRPVVAARPRRTVVFENKKVVVTGGTGSLGERLVRRLLGGEAGLPERVVVFSRDEAKQHAMRLSLRHIRAATDEVIYQNTRVLEFRIGDVRDPRAVGAALRGAHVVFHAAALKQVPSCEYFPSEAVATNVGGAENVVRVIRELGPPVETVVGVSTDKACKPVNVMGMTKALQERVFQQANLDAPGTRFVCVRYGNVLASRGSVVPFFHEQIRRGGPVTITTPEMTRFLLSLDDAVDTVLAAARHGRAGELFVPRAPAARVTDLAEVLIAGRPIRTEVVGVRPGEKTHEILVSEEEAGRTCARHGHYVIQSILPELAHPLDGPPLRGELSSADWLMTAADLRRLLLKNRLLFPDGPEARDGVAA